MCHREAVYQSADEIGQAFALLTRGPRIQRVFDEVRARAGVDLDRPAFIVLDALDARGSLRMSELAEACGVDVSTMSRLVARLQRARLVTTSQIVGDRRVVVLEATSMGLEQARRLKEARRDGLAAFLCEWTADERATFARLLSRFVVSMGDLAEREAAGVRGVEE